MTRAGKHKAKIITPNMLSICLLSMAILLVSWLWIRPVLVFFAQGRTLLNDVFIPWKDAFASKPFYPGVVIDHAAAVVSYVFYNWNFAAAVIVTVLGVWLYVIAKKITGSFRDYGLEVFSAVPAALLMMQYGRYYHYISEPMSVVLAATVFYFYDKIKTTKALKMGVWFVVSFLFYVAAVKGVVVFVLLGIVCEMIKKNFRNSIELAVLAIVAVFAANAAVFKQSLLEAYQVLFIYHPNMSVWDNVVANMLVVIFPVLVVVSIVLDDREIFKRVRMFRYTTATILVVAATFVSADYSQRSKRLIDYYGENENWEQLLRAAEKMPEKDFDIIICHDVNRALYHRGRLVSGMLDYPQHYQSLLLSNHDKLTGGVLWLVYAKLGSIYYELGDINQAQRYTSEALELAGYYPKAMQQLALINIVKEQYSAARVYLKALRKDPLYRKWVGEYLKKIDSPELLARDKEIMQKRRLWVCEDSELSKRYAPRDLFAANNKNRMAYEYMMAFCLLTGQVEPVANSIKYLDALRYPRGRIPKLYEEAILLYSQMSGKKADLGRRKLSVESLERFQRFSQSISQTANMSASQAAEVLSKDFKNTYYYYYHFLRPKQ